MAKRDFALFGASRLRRLHQKADQAVSIALQSIAFVEDVSRLVPDDAWTDDRRTALEQLLKCREGLQAGRDGVRRLAEGR
jgi:hypothetical protein